MDRALLSESKGHGFNSHRAQVYTGNIFIKQPMLNTQYYYSPIGWMLLSTQNNLLVELRFQDKPTNTTNALTTQDNYLDYVIEQITAYFCGKLKYFQIQHEPTGSSFQQNIWNFITNHCSFGNTMSYKEVAENVGCKVKSPRATGQALKKNKLHIIIPCHRVIHSNNKTGGYAGGVWRKNFLLMHEKKFL